MNDTSKSASSALGIWPGLGWWNIYFIAKLVAAGSSLTLLPVWNTLLLIVLLWPLKSPAVKLLRQVVCIPAGIALFYAETWLPSPMTIWNNAIGLSGFSWDYIGQLIWNFVNPSMVGWLVVIILAYVLLRNYLRITVVSVVWFVVAIFFPFAHTALSPDIEAPAVSTARVASTLSTADSATIGKWYSAFLGYEKDRRVTLPQQLKDGDEPFDILFLNVGSLSNSDLLSAGLAKHPVLGSFQIQFDRFNSATSYAPQAALRLLTSTCGQPSNTELMSARRPACELFNQLEALGFTPRLFMDHSGKYENFLQMLQTRAGFSALPEVGRSYPVRYVGFDGESIADDLSVLRAWLKSVSEDLTTQRSVTLMNFMALHDGNRAPTDAASSQYNVRAKLFLDSLQSFFNDLQKSGRKAMVVLVPGQGSGLQGDRIQSAGMKDIPSPLLTEVPVMVKFFGLPNLPREPMHVAGTTSYLALASLVSHVVSANYFSAPAGAVPMTDLVRGLPETSWVAETPAAAVLEYKNAMYVRLRGDSWQTYPQGK